MTGWLARDSPGPVTSVLIFAQAPGLCCLCVGAKPGQPGISASQPARAKDLRRAPGGPGHPACRQGHAGPGLIAVPCRNVANWRIRQRRTRRMLSKHHCAHKARPSITAAHRPITPQTTPATLRPELGLRTATRNFCSAFQNRADYQLLSTARPKCTIIRAHICLFGVATGGADLVPRASRQPLRWARATCQTCPAAATSGRRWICRVTQLWAWVQCTMALLLAHRRYSITC